MVHEDGLVHALSGWHQAQTTLGKIRAVGEVMDKLEVSRMKIPEVYSAQIVAPNLRLISFLQTRYIPRFPLGPRTHAATPFHVDGNMLL